MRKREIAYNTDIIRRGPELDELGYISINKLLLTRIDRRLIIKEAREGHNNLALNSSCPAEVFIKQEFYNNYLLQNSKQNPFLDIKIESKDSKFIEKLARFLKKQKNVNFSVISYLGIDLKNSKEEKISFLSSNLVDINLGSRTLNCLNSVDITYVFGIVDFKDNLMKIRKFDAHSLKEIKTEFAKKGLDFQYIPKELMEAARLRCGCKQPN